MTYLEFLHKCAAVTKSFVVFFFNAMGNKKEEEEGKPARYHEIREYLADNAVVQGMSNAYNALIAEITEGAVDGTIRAGEMCERDDFLRGPRHDAQVVRTDIRVPSNNELYCDFRDDDFYYVMYEADGFQPRSRPEFPKP